MILTICPNPSIDCTIELNNLNVGRVNRIENKMLTYSGKAINVAIGVRRLGGESTVTGFMFENDGKSFLHNLDKEGVRSNFIWNEGSVRVNYKMIDVRSMMTEINDKGEMVSAEKQRELISLAASLAKECSVAVMSGSLPQGVNEGYYASLVKAMPQGVKVFVDAEGDKLLHAIRQSVYLVKPNLAELESILKMQLKSKKEMVGACRKLIDMGAENVLLSLGQQGAIFTDGTTSYFAKTANVAVNSTVGAGDSMVSAAAYMVERGADKAEVLKCAVAAGTASITTPGTNLFYKDKYEEIYGKIKVEEIQF
ncbi:MAG: 1-phosphofructokinase family hexose kinase [Clostridia bacterium]|nr:1-phosphofructokinase family hexose kinase [Clostridia bacterium]